MDPREDDHADGGTRFPMPEAHLPARQAQLRRGLVALSRRSQAERQRRALLPARPKRALFGSIAAALTVVGSVALFMVVNQATVPITAVATFHVNPAFSITIDAKSVVAQVTTHDEDAEALLEGVDLAGTPLREAVDVIAAELRRAGHVMPASDVSVAVRPAEDGSPENAAAVARELGDWLSGAMGAHVSITVVSLSAADFAYLEDNHLLPGDYAHIIAQTGSVELLREITASAREYFTDEELAPDRFRAITEAANEMVEAGIAPADARALIEAAMAARQDVGALSEFAYAYGELTSLGLSYAESLALITRSIAAGWDADAVYEYADELEKRLQDGEYRQPDDTDQNGSGPRPPKEADRDERDYGPSGPDGEPYERDYGPSGPDGEPYER